MGNGGIGLGGILVIVGIVLAIVWSLWWGLIIGLSGSSSSAASQRASGTENRLALFGVLVVRGTCAHHQLRHASRLRDS